LKTDRAARVFALLAALILLWPHRQRGAFERRRVQGCREYYKLPNGLGWCSRRTILRRQLRGRVLRIGFRIEPRDRTGLRQLFDTHDVPGIAESGEMEFIKLVQQNGRILNGSTRFDFTNYFEVLPANKLETVLWRIGPHGRAGCERENLKNQQGVVGNEVKVNVLNRPYGGFPWIDIRWPRTRTGSMPTTSMGT